MQLRTYREAASGPLGKSGDDRHSIEPNILLEQEVGW